MKRKKVGKKKKKIGIIILIFILISILILNPFFPGCPNANSNDLDLKISSSKDILKMNETNFPITFKLICERPYPVCIERGFTFGYNIYLKLNGPMGELLIQHAVSDKVLTREFLIGEKEYTENIAKYDARYEDSSFGDGHFSWNITGNYTLYSVYNSAFMNNDIESNTIRFEIKE